jgi:peptide/nickel transport system substrate-binding protein
VAVQRISGSNTFETAREQSNVGYRLSPSFAESLIESDWTNQLRQVPGLATAWRRVDDTTVEFDLRPGVRFHDGRIMSAEDVAFSFGPRLYGGEEAGPRVPPREVIAVGRRTFPDFGGIQIVRDGVVRFVNRAPDVTLEGRLQQNIGTIFSRASFERAPDWLSWARAPVGTGPYRIAAFRPDTELMLEAHDEYWGGRPPVRRIRVIEVPEVASRIAALLSGECDFASDIPPDQIATVERNPRFEVLGSPINNIRIIAFDSSNPVLRDPRIRRALTHALDRDLIVTQLWSGRTRVPKGLQLEFYGEMFLPDWNVPAFDPDLARRLVRESGYRGQPIPYRLQSNYYTNQVANAQIMVEMWRQAGLNVVLEMKETGDQIMDRTSPRGIRDWSNTSLFNDPVSGLVRGMGPRGELQLSGEWSHAEFNRLVPELESSTDRARRRMAFRRMLEIIEREDPGFTVLHQAATFTAKRKDIHWRASHGWGFDFRAGNLRFGA